MNPGAVASISRFALSSITSVASPSHSRYWASPGRGAYVSWAWIELWVGATMIVVVGIVLLIASALWIAFGDALVHHLRDRRAARPPAWEVCRGCGYNLIASRDRCPECGRPIPPWPTERPRIRLVRGHVVVRSGRDRAGSSGQASVRPRRVGSAIRK